MSTEVGSWGGAGAGWSAEAARKGGRRGGGRAKRLAALDRARAVEGDGVTAAGGGVPAGGGRRRRARKTERSGEGSGSSGAAGTVQRANWHATAAEREAERAAILAADAFAVVIRRAVVAADGVEADVAGVLAAMVGEAERVGGGGAVEVDGRRVVAVVRFPDAWREDKWLDRTEALEAMLEGMVERDDGVEVERAAA